MGIKSGQTGSVKIKKVLHRMKDDNMKDLIYKPFFSVLQVDNDKEQKKLNKEHAAMKKKYVDIYHFPCAKNNWLFSVTFTGSLPVSNFKYMCQIVGGQLHLKLNALGARRLDFIATVLYTKFVIPATQKIATLVGCLLCTQVGVQLRCTQRTP